MSQTVSALTVAAGVMAALLINGTAQAADVDIYTGSKTGAYDSSFCPVLREKLQKDGHTVDCRPTAGTGENMQRVSDDPFAFAYGQRDILALGADLYGRNQPFEYVRSDDVRECLFAVTRSKDLTNFGEVAVRSPEISFVLPPRNSGSAQTFAFLQQIDPYGLGRADNIAFAQDTDAALEDALTNPNTVTLFVQFPDPDNPRFKMIQERGGHIIPVLDRNILDQRLDGEPIYFAQETQVANNRWLRSGRKVVTSCTPLVLFTGRQTGDADDRRADAHQRLIETIRAYRADSLLPRQSLFARVIRRTRQLSSAGAERVISLSEQARERAGPILERAREAAERAAETAAERAKPRLQPNE